MGTTLRVVGNGEKKIVGSDARKPTEEDLLKAENQLREEARTLIQEIDRKYWDLGRVLWDVYDGVPGGYRALMSGEGSRKDRVALFEKWGYKNFGEYCENEVGLRKRTAENLRFAYYYFAIQQEMPDNIVEQLMSIGRSKVYLLAGIATKSSIALWLEKAKELTFEELKKAVQTAKAVAAGKNVDNEEREPQSIKAGSSSADESDGEDEEKYQPKDLPQPDQWHVISGNMVTEQYEVYQAALKRAGDVTGSDKVGYNLDFICQDFLANNNFSNIKEKDRSTYLSKMERRIGLSIIAVDTNTGKPVHGRDLLWRLIEAAGGKMEK
jgi:hypothetical protein